VLYTAHEHSYQHGTFNRAYKKTRATVQEPNSSENSPAGLDVGLELGPHVGVEVK
jgi:hypothetical protein